jgi:hypothetical protein
MRLELMLDITLFKVPLQTSLTNLISFRLLPQKLSLSTGWEKRFPNDSMYKTSKLVENMVKEGKLGQKTGEGWYKYKK